MKKTIILLMIVLVSIVGNAADELTIGQVTIPQGGQASINISLSNQEKSYTAGQMMLNLPNGITSILNDKGDPTTVKGERIATSDHSIGATHLETGTDQFTIFSISSEPFGGNEGTLFTILIEASDDLAVGTILEGKLTGIEMTTTDATPIPFNDISISITIGENRLSLDESSTTIPDEAENVNVKVKRTINAGNWSTICLPFAMTEEQVKTAFGNDVELGDFTGYDTTEEGDDITGITVNFDNATEIEANHPYIIKVSAPIAEFTVDGVDISPEDVPCVSFGFTTGKGSKAVYHPIDFNGTYVADFDFFNDAQSQALFLSENKFYYATENTKHMKAFRAYFDFDDVLSDVESSSARIAMRFDSITDINKVSEKKSDTSGAIYDLQGRRVNKPIKGIFIKEGKKIVIEN